MFEDDLLSGDLAPLKTRDQLELLVPLTLVLPTPEKLGPAGRLLAGFIRDTASDRKIL